MNTLFKDLKHGDLFRHNGQAYVRIRFIEQDMAGMAANCMDTDGYGWYIDNDEEVEYIGSLNDAAEQLQHRYA